MKQFSIPEFYKSPIVSKIKLARRMNDPRKQDLSPSILDFGPVKFFIARHFGFCYGVENAIEISFKAIAENPDKRIFLLSQMIHNQDVNNDLVARGVKFLMDTQGNPIIPFDELKKSDIVIIPAFGTTLEIENKLMNIGIEVHKYDTTCPFVERVWKRSEKLGQENYSVIIHGKHNHEETRATFSRSEINTPSIIVKDMEEAQRLGAFILGKITVKEFNTAFHDRCSSGFNPQKDMQRVGVINQTTMLASETEKISNYFREVMKKKYGEKEIKKHFSDTRDTLCYATNENQEATYALLKQKGDAAIVVGGYNSSNTSHIVELCEKKLPTYFINSEQEIISSSRIKHYNYHEQKHLTTENFLPEKESVEIILTSGASCPDSLVDRVLRRILSFFPKAKETNVVMQEVLADNSID